MSPWLRLVPLLAPYRMRIGAAVLLAIAACLLNVLSPLLIERLLILAGDRGSMAVLFLPAAFLLAAVVMQALASSANAWLLGSVSLNVVRDLRKSLYQRLQTMPMAWFDRTPVGAIMSRVMDDAAAVQSLTSGQALVTLIDLSTAVGAAIWLLSKSWRLAAAVALVAPLYVVIFRLFTRPIHSGTLDVRRQLDQLFGNLKQKIDGILVIRSAGSEASEVSEFTRQISALHQPRLRLNQLGIAFSNLCVGVGGIGAAVVFALGASEVLAGRLSIGDLIATSALAGLMFTPITRLSELATTYQQAAASVTRLGEILNSPAPPVNLSLVRGAPAVGGIVEPPITGRLELDRLAFRYDEDRPVLQEVSLAIEPGTKVAIVGPTGSGKTTLMNLLLGFYEPTTGQIRLDGRPIAQFPRAVLRQNIGVVPQEAVVFRGSLADNIRYGAPAASLSEVEAASAAALVDTLAAHLPKGYDTLVGEGGHPLSQGERQRIAIARLFCKDPSVVVLDEATSALDRQSEALVQEALDRLLAGRTTLVIAHRLATVLAADKIVVMDQGRIVQTGTHAELLADEAGLYRKLHDSQLAPAEHQPQGPRLPDPHAPAEILPHAEAIPA